MEITKEISGIDTICHIISFVRGESKLHWHDRYEICQVIDKSCRFLVDGEIYHAGTGDIIAINDKVIHQFLVDEDATPVRICQFPFKSLINSSSIFNPLKIHITAEEINAVAGLSEKLNMLFGMMEDENATVHSSAHPFRQSLANAVYFLLERHFPSASQGDKIDERDRAEFFKIVDYINAHFKEEINVEQIARGLYCSRGRLTAVFKKYASESISDYISKIRVKNANILLAEGASVTKAALESGFSNTRTFNNVYKSVMQITPSEYLKIKK